MATDPRVPADLVWQSAVNETPVLVSAFERIGERNRGDRSRTRRFASELDAGPLSTAQIALELQLASAAAGDRDAVRRVRNRLRSAQSVDQAEARRTRRAAPAAAASALTPLRTVIVVLVLLAAITGPVLMFPRRRRAGFILPIEDAAPWTAALSLVAAIVTILFLRRLAALGGGRGLHAVLGGVTAIAFALMIGRMPPQPDASLTVSTALVGFAVVVYAVSVVRLWPRREPQDPPPSAHHEEAARAALLEVLAGEPVPIADLRRVAYAEGVRVLLRRQAVEADAGRMLLTGWSC